MPDNHDYPIHPAAELFPPLSDSELAELTGDIRANGLLSPIKLYKGAILDGRHRLKACQKAGRRPEFQEVTPADPFEYVRAMNILRRHLTTEQRAAIAAEIATRKPGGQPGNANAAETKGSKEPAAFAPPTAAQAAKLMNVSQSSVKRAIARKKRDPAAHAAAKAAKKSVRKTEPVAQVQGSPETVSALLQAMCPRCRKAGEELRALLRKQIEEEIERDRAPQHEAPTVALQ